MSKSTEISHLYFTSFNFCSRSRSRPNWICSQLNSLSQCFPQVKIWFQNRRSKHKKLNKGQGNSGGSGGSGQGKGNKNYDPDRGTPDSDASGSPAPNSVGSRSPVPNMSPVNTSTHSVIQNIQGVMNCVARDTGMMQQHAPNVDPNMNCTPPTHPYTPPIQPWDIGGDAKPSPFGMTNGVNVPGPYANFITAQHHHQHHHPAPPTYWYPSENINHQAKWPNG